MASRRNQGPPNPLNIQALLNTFWGLDPRVQLVVVALLVLAAIAFAIAWIEAQRYRAAATRPPAPLSIQMLLGNPSNANDDPANHDNYLMIKPYFALSYNSTKGIPNWVSWRVAASDLGAAARKEEFDPDTTLPPGFNQVIGRDYDHSGFDRGHMCPHSDRGASLDMSFSTFIMTNVIPQAPSVNRKAWEELESYGRTLVKHDHLRLYITSGPAGQGGRGSRGFMQSLAGGKVVVPAQCWKIVVCVPDDGGEEDLPKISLTTRVISVMMPNDDEAVGDEWAGFRTNPAAIERSTGLHFFDRVRPDVADSLRQSIDALPVPPPRPHHYSNQPKSARPFATVPD